MQPERPLDAWRARYLARIDHLKGLINSLQEALATNPDLRPVLAEELRALLDEPAAQPEPVKVQPGASIAQAVVAGPIATDGGPSLRKRIVNFFRDRNNEPASIEKIHEAVGGAASSVRGMLYKKPRNNGWFDRVPIQGGADRWQLAPQRYRATLIGFGIDDDEDDSDTDEVKP